MVERTGVMMNISYFGRFSTVAAGCLAVATLMGCGSDDEPVEVVEEEPEFETLTLFDDSVDLVSGTSEPLEVDVPEGVYSLAVSITEGNGTNIYSVTDWTAPDGFEIVPEGWEQDDGEICYPSCSNRVYASAGAAGALAPNNPDPVDAMQPGNHEFTVFSASMLGGGMFLDDSINHQSSMETVQVTVHAKIAEEHAPEHGVLDLNLFFTGAEGWDAESAPDDPEVQNVIAEIDELYDQVNIDIGEVAYHDVNASFQIIEDMITGTGDLSEMFTESSRGELDGPSVFFVRDLQSPMGGGGRGGVLGISGGIPGPMLVDGSARSGVAIATESSQGGFGAPGIAKVTAHELGHYLGLFHTSEQMAGFGGSTPSHDPLPDTDRNDESYLMHATGGGSEISDWQGRVMRKNPWVQIPE